jgi:hypothetical protein
MPVLLWTRPGKDGERMDKSVTLARRHGIAMRPMNRPDTDEDMHGKHP